jgi:hypothetical protein
MLKNLNIKPAASRSAPPDLTRWFVYSYWSKGRPVYVGKGTGRRDRSHLADFERAHGLTVNRIHTHDQHLSEAGAFALEVQLIRKFGRRGIDPKGTLLNATEGGSRSMRGWVTLYR